MVFEVPGGCKKVREASRILRRIIKTYKKHGNSEANKKLVPQIVSKANKQIRVVDANTFSTAAVDATVDIAMTGLPEVRVYENGNIGRRL